MIYTSYFGNYKQFPEGSVIVSITQYAPKGWDGVRLRSLAPSAELLQRFKNKEIDETIFGYQYKAQLDKDVNLRPRVQALLWHLDNEYKNVILCCYEKKGEFCHRQILRDWLQMNVEEL